jgi:hypothetical protein
VACLTHVGVLLVVLRYRRRNPVGAESG